LLGRVDRLQPSRVIVLAHGVVELVAAHGLGVQVMARPDWDRSMDALAFWVYHNKPRQLLIPVAPQHADKAKVLGMKLTKWGITHTTFGVPEGGLGAWIADGNGLDALKQQIKGGPSARAA
jgi:S-adenosylhomocysteine hydrolase